MFYVVNNFSACRFYFDWSNIFYYNFQTYVKEELMRVKTGIVRRRRHKKIRELAKGYYGQKHSTFKKANEAVLRSLQYSYAHRRLKKRDMRKLWIIRINAAAREEGLNYSKLISGLRKANVVINRKMLAELAVNNPLAFSELAKIAKAHVNS